MTSIQNGSGNFSIMMTPLEERKHVAAAADAGRRGATLRKYQGRPHQRVGRHRHLRRVDRRRRRPRRRRRRRRRQQPAEHDRAGTRTSSSCRTTPCTLLDEGAARSTASSTSTRTSRRRSRSCGSTSTAQRAADLGVNIDTLPTTCARWSAARKCRSSRTATSSSTSGCGSTSRSATIRRRWATSSCPPAGGRMVRVSDVAHLTIDNAPASIDRYNRHAPDLGERQPRCGDHARRGRSPRRAARSDELHLKAGLPGGVRRQRADAQPRRRNNFAIAHRARGRRSSTWCWRRSSTASSTR